MYLNREDRNQEHTIYVGDLDPQVNESLLWELFIQVAPVGTYFSGRGSGALRVSLARSLTAVRFRGAVSVHTPKDKLSGQHSGFGFVEFHSEEDAEYACKIMNMIKLFGKPIKVNKSQRDKRVTDVGANLFVGNLSPEVDERLLYDTFSAFGTIIQTPKIMRDTDTGGSKGYRCCVAAFLRCFSLLQTVC
jgi:splicing factor 3B subunit 4